MRIWRRLRASPKFLKELRTAALDVGWVHAGLHHEGNQLDAVSENLARLGVGGAETKALKDDQDVVVDADHVHFKGRVVCGLAYHASK